MTDMGETVIVRTSMQPDRDLEVSISEATDLFRQGLLVEDQPKQGKAAGTASANK